MAITYDNLWKLLIDKKCKKTDLINMAKISSSALAKLGRDEPVSLVVIEKICFFLDCNIEDVVTIKKNDNLNGFK